jgi:hypothetical protein
MLATSALHFSGHRRRQIACRSGTSLGLGRGENHLAPNQGSAKSQRTLVTVEMWKE